MIRDRGPMPHLTWGELACKDHARTAYPNEHRLTRALPLAITFEWLRAHIGDRPLHIGSAYRTSSHNAIVGGAPNSMHLYGLALDLYPPTGLTPMALYDAASDVLDANGGLFLYAWGIHLDRRDLVDRPAARGDYRKAPRVRLPIEHRFTL